MNNKLKSLFLIGFLALGLTGCISNQTKGSVIGGISGAAIGNQFGKGSGNTAATVVGAVAGTYFGNQIGSSMDENERLRRENAALKAQLASGGGKVYDVARWTTKEDAGVFFDPNPEDQYIYHDYQACVKEPVYRVIDGVNQRVIKVKCRQANGDFKYVW